MEDIRVMTDISKLIQRKNMAYDILSAIHNMKARGFNLPIVTGKKGRGRRKEITPRDHYM
jgi:hypothetical protein